MVTLGGFFFDFFFRNVSFFAIESLDVQDYGDVEIAHRKYSPDYPRNMRNYGQIVGTVANLAR